MFQECALRVRFFSVCRLLVTWLVHFSHIAIWQVAGGCAKGMTHVDDEASQPTDRAVFRSELVRCTRRGTVLAL